jgi:hypothetical protein
MSFKTKALGLVAAAALSLSITTGVMAEESTGSSVNLGPNPDGTCSLAISQGEDANFGDWHWTGTEFVANDGTSTVVVWMSNTQNIAPNNEDVNCVFSVKGSDLTGPNDSTIPVGNITATHGSGHTIVLSDQYQLLGGIVNSAGTTFDLDLTVQALPDDLYLGEYSGTVSFTAALGS